MPLSPEVVDARIHCRVAELKVMAARIGLRRSEPVECLPPVLARRPRSRRDALPPLARRSGGDGHPSS
jgi:hypothetical protein